MSRKEKEQVLVIFVDDTDFFSTEEEVIEKMIQLLQTHAELFQDTGGRIQYEKIACFSWKQEWKKGKKEIINKPVEIEIEGTKIKMEYCKDSIRILGIHMNLERNQSKQFIIMVSKMRTIVAKLIHTTIIVLLICIYFNTYLMKLVYFGCRIIKLNKE